MPGRFVTVLEMKGLRTLVSLFQWYYCMIAANGTAKTTSGQPSDAIGLAVELRPAP